MRFLADENVSQLVVERLRAAGLDVASVRETRPGGSDKDVLDQADRDDRILVTEDRDFGELVVRQRLKFGGVILLELDRLPNAAEAERVAEVVRVHATKLTGNLLVASRRVLASAPCRGKPEGVPCRRRLGSRTTAASGRLRRPFESDAVKSDHPAEAGVHVSTLPAADEWAPACAGVVLLRA